MKVVDELYFQVTDEEGSRIARWPGGLHTSTSCPHRQLPLPDTVLLWDDEEQCSIQEDIEDFDAFEMVFALE